MPTASPLRFDEIRIENTNHCGYWCICCPREALSRPRGVMPLSDLQIVLDRVGLFSSSVDLHGFGEPLLDRLLPERVEAVRRAWPTSKPRIITTMGIPLPEGFAVRLATCGLARIEVSCYGENAERYRRMHRADRFDLAISNVALLARTFATTPNAPVLVLRTGLAALRPEFDGGAAVPPELSEYVEQGLIVLQPQRPLHNFGYGRAYNAARNDRVCSVAWGYRRRVLQITWDLFVIPCCFDFDAAVKLGDLRTQSLDEVFTGDTYNRFIAAHLANTIDDFGPCRTCEKCSRP